MIEIVVLADYTPLLFVDIRCCNKPYTYYDSPVMFLNVPYSVSLVMTYLACLLHVLLKYYYYTVNLEIFVSFFSFRKTTHRRSFVKIISSPNGKTTLSFTATDKSCPSRKYLTSQICLLMLFAKIKFS